MKQTLKGLTVAAVPATLGILFGIGVILYGINGHKTEEAAAKPEGTKQEQAAGGATSEIGNFVTQNCATCHGQGLKGGFGPKLVGTALDEKAIVDILKNGKGQMPKDLAKGKEEEVAKYLKSLK
ncbi:c-type cytochrome [Effusibacillus lacus]|uniref:Cytochrome C n=1 Tax=Effusibacillus lacus TaxID=1348429 RepID=A0A292YT39_9BACL|nr:cytochrome c [Effusibacillus lacus]TCS76392.1 cytochrome c551 [Effusibacillus lacus]GAX91933.1 cytochrome C [Effusibacillus lacus]